MKWEKDLQVNFIRIVIAMNNYSTKRTLGKKSDMFTKVPFTFEYKNDDLQKICAMICLDFVSTNLS